MILDLSRPRYQRKIPKIPPRNLNERKESIRTILPENKHSNNCFLRLSPPISPPCSPPCSPRVIKKMVRIKKNEVWNKFQ